MQRDRTPPPGERRPPRAAGAALLLAVLALLLNQALLSAPHGAARGGSPDGHAAHHLCGADDRDVPGDPAGLDHQGCHFCRTAGAALPPPPSQPIGRLEAARDVAWSDAGRDARPSGASRLAHPPRGPPRTV